MQNYVQHLYMCDLLRRKKNDDVYTRTTWCRNYVSSFKDSEYLLAIRAINKIHHRQVMKVNKKETYYRQFKY